MTPQKKIGLLKSIAQEVSDKLHCDRYGSCVHFAEIFVDEVNEQYPELLNDFHVIEGYVNTKIGEGRPQEHTWIRLENDEIIDPTFLQFTQYDTKSSYSKRKSKIYSGQEYYDQGKEGSWFSERRKQQPKTVFKESAILKQSIKRILREETHIPSVIRRRVSAEDIEEAFEHALDRMGNSMENPNSVIYKEKGTTLWLFAKFVIDEMVTYLEQDYFSDDNRIYFSDDDYYYDKIRKPLLRHYGSRIKERYYEII
jgi:hypothetical protein